MSRIRKYVGLSLGSACDGIDAALVGIEGQDTQMSARIEAFQTIPLDQGLRDALIRAVEGRLSSPLELADIEGELVDALVEAEDLLEQHTDADEDIDACGLLSLSAELRNQRTPGRGLWLELGFPPALCQEIEL